ncbi:hypothetical protein HK413_05600 [Mucilaginibacter sp. S1162]|uniref:DUF3267 domain-containing protein n=1 Tax=Mucilaginibacter humi TaxID=2732510 RepID=A0ABX1W0K3_9SPHI|nr:hypothetical protein [Mucilaginibacter humi]NNU33746.1 hypothetical protein [Mucilaginibacter humi]
MAFVFVFGQLHEMAHMITGYLICGQSGIQLDFNLIRPICAACENSPYTYISGIAGPLFSYLMMWTGYFILRSENTKRYGLGFVLILGNLAFARIFTAGMGGGDERGILTYFFSNQPLLLIKAINFLLVFTLAFPPIYMAYKRLANKHKLLVISGFCVVPLCIMYPYEFMLLGEVLKSGFLAKRHLLGVADMIYLHTAIMGMIVVFFRKTLFKAYTNSIT